MPLQLPGMSMQNNIEPMVVDMAMEENENTEDDPVIVESTSLDLESYANNYTGLAKLQRLLFIAERCPPLRVEALRMAIKYIQMTYNVTMYTQLHKKLQEAIGGGNLPGSNLPDVAGGPVGAVGQSVTTGLPGLDLVWIETRSKKAALKLEKLDTDLKNSKMNSIKESIRRGHDDLGDHYLDCGDLSNALKCYSRARDYCTSFRHIINMCLNVIKVSIYLTNWSHVLSYVTKANATPDIAEPKPTSNKDQTAVIQTKLTCAAGLAHLATKKYKQAAKDFLCAQLDACELPELLSVSNVAMYGGLCALATYSRSELYKSVIASSSFKLFLEAEPQLRDIILKFYESKYANCLKLLDGLKDVLMLDIYLAPHLKTLYSKIRNRALVQYFSPYMSADLERMAVAFNTSVPALEDELMALILDGQIQARIDSHNKILYAKAIEERSVTFERSLEMGREHIMRVKGLVLRSALVRNQIHVKSPPREGGGGSQGDGVLATSNNVATGPRN